MAVPIVIAVLSAVPAMGQVRVSMEPELFSFEISFTAKTSFGQISASDEILARGDGLLVLTLFPAEGSATHARLHDFELSIPFLQAQYPILGGASEVSISVVGLTISVPPEFECSDAEINGPQGSTVFNDPLIVSGVVEFREDFFFGLMGEVDVTRLFAPIAGDLHSDGGVFEFEMNSLPTFSETADPDDLPIDIFSLTASVDLISIRFSGVGTFAFGDSDADGAVTLFDYADYIDCVSGPATLADVYCGLFDFDGDGDIDLHDWGGLQSEFTAQTP